MMRAPSKIILFLLMIALTSQFVGGQSRNNSKGISSIEGSVVSVTARRVSGNEPVTLQEIFLYENSVEQRIRNFAFDTSPSRIVLLVDNSQGPRAELDALKAGVLEFAYEIYEGDQMFVVAFDEKAEIVQEWTDDADKVLKSTKSFRKQGNPHLFDALSAASRQILLPLMPGLRKTAIVMITDGLDRGSDVSYQNIIRELQASDITVYALQLPDRTNGAFRRNQPKAPRVLKEITEATGGAVYQFSEARSAARAICDELKNNRYLLSYFPTSQASSEDRNIFAIGKEGITVRTKSMHPGLR